MLQTLNFLCCVCVSEGHLNVFICHCGSLWERRGRTYAGTTRQKILFPRHGAAHNHAQEPTPGFAVEFWGQVCARTAPWFRGQTLLVLGHVGGPHGGRGEGVLSEVFKEKWGEMGENWGKWGKMEEKNGCS